jgi:hypothetical protein
MDTRPVAPPVSALGIGAGPAGSRRQALRALLGGVGGLALVGAAPMIAEAALDADWRLCKKCRGIVGGSPSRPCLAGGEHRLAMSTVYALFYGSDPPPNHEAGWRWCNDCGLLTYKGFGPCPATGDAHNPISDSYFVELNQPVDPGEAGGWRYCFKCETLFRPKGRNRGVCPAGGRHKGSPDYKYNVYKAP